MINHSGNISQEASRGTGIELNFKPSLQGNFYDTSENLRAPCEIIQQMKENNFFSQFWGNY